MIIIYIIIITLGFCPLAIALYKMNKTKAMKTVGIRAMATVRQIKAYSSNGMNNVEIEYTIKETGQVVTKTIIVAGSPYQTGQQLPMYYSTENPYAMVLDPGKSYTLILVFTLLIALFMITACFLIQNSIDKGEL